MCGIAGFTTGFAPGGPRHSDAARRVVAMTAALTHRGPDAQRAVVLDGVAFGHTRLSIVDPAGGDQPMRGAGSGVCAVFNGEIFNHVELRHELRDYRFRTHSDTEVIIAAYERWGLDCVERFNGQWAFALWDPRDRILRLSRDRVGVRPLYFAETPEGVAFASEIKALFAGRFVTPELDPFALKETTCLWAPVAPRTSVAGVQMLPPGCSATVADGRVRVRRYWSLDLKDARVDASMTVDGATESVGELLDDSVRLRLRADVPVAAYLSGGLDSSLICALAQRQLRATGSRLATFSVSFADPRYDESGFQRQVADAIGSEHRELRIGGRDIGALLPDVIRLTEQPLLRSAPAPLLALSRVVRDHRTKVVLTGEGADEFFWGYQLYQETKVRRFWARQPQSQWRYRLLHRLYPYLRLADQPATLLRQFYGVGLEYPDQPGFSHLLRWLASRRIWRFFSRPFAEQVREHDPVQELLSTTPAGFSGWRPLARAQWLEVHTLLSGYLLSAQGDRMLMGNSVEGRFPFLDHRLVELAASLPDAVKMRVLDGKHVVKRVAASRVPRIVIDRPKTPYRAPISETLVGPGAPAWTRDAFHPDAIAAAGVFDPGKVQSLRKKLAQLGQASGESDNMALMAIASVQLLHSQLLHPSPPSAAAQAAVQVVASQARDAHPS